MLLEVQLIKNCKQMLAIQEHQQTHKEQEPKYYLQLKDICIHFHITVKIMLFM